MKSKLYVVDNGFTNEGCVLYMMDPVTLSVAKIGSVLGEDWTINGLASNGEKLYGWAVQSNENDPWLVSINKCTGAGILIGAIGMGPVSSLAVNKAGVIWAVAGNEGTLKLIRIDSVTAQSVDVGSVEPSIQSVGSMIFDTLDNCYTLINVNDISYPNNDGTYLSAVNTETGMVNIGSGMKFTDPSNAKDISSMAYCDNRLLGGTGISKIYNIKAPIGEVEFMGQPNSIGDFLLSGMTACYG